MKNNNENSQNTNRNSDCNDNNDGKKYVKDYELSQYEDIDLKFFSSKGVEARYIEQELPAYKGNVLIEALPPKLDEIQTHRALRRVPFYGEAERYKSDIYRLDAVMGLNRFIYVRNEMVQIATTFDSILRRGYADKYINTAKYKQSLSITGEALRNSKKKEYQLTMNVVEKPIDSPMASSMCIIGASGEGKSTVINRILSRYPQLIHHTTGIGNYKEFNQIVWIKIECVSNKRITGLILNFLGKIDEVIGTDFAIRYKGSSQEQLKLLMKQLIKYFGIGSLVIDEMQHIGKTTESETIFNELVSLVNEVNIPIVYIGTYQLKNTVFDKQFRHGRRGEGIGTYDLVLLDGEEFDTFLMTLWKYQWTKKYVELTPAIKKVMYEKTLGIVDYIVKIFIVTQIEAIYNGTEKITAKLINQVANKNFKMTKKQREAYRSNDIDQIIKCADLLPVDIQIIQDDRKSRIEADRKIKEYCQSKEYLSEVKTDDAVMDVATHFVQEGFQQEHIEKIARNVIKKHGLLQRPELLKKVGKLLREEKEE